MRSSQTTNLLNIITALIVSAALIIPLTKSVLSTVYPDAISELLKEYKYNNIYGK